VHRHHVFNFLEPFSWYQNNSVHLNIYLSSKVTIYLGSVEELDILLFIITYQYMDVVYIVMVYYLDAVQWWCIVASEVQYVFWEFEAERITSRVFDETLFRIFAKHETRENAPVFRETFASFLRSNFRERDSRKTTEHARSFKKSGEIENNQ
jgi:hypothetical protein